MNATDIVAKLFSAKGITPDRIQKAKGLAMRAQIDWLNVVIAMTPDQRKAVENAG